VNNMMTDIEIINAKLDDIEKRCNAATQGPWTWNKGPGGAPQLEGSVHAPDINPILCVLGCNVDDGGCFPDGLRGDKLRMCPLHPSKADRDFILEKQ